MPPETPSSAGRDPVSPRRLHAVVYGASFAAFLTTIALDSHDLPITHIIPPTARCAAHLGGFLSPRCNRFLDRYPRLAEMIHKVSVRLSSTSAYLSASGNVTFVPNVFKGLPYVSLADATNAADIVSSHGTLLSRLQATVHHLEAMSDGSIRLSLRHDEKSTSLRTRCFILADDDPSIMSMLRSLPSHRLSTSHDSLLPISKGWFRDPMAQKHILVSNQAAKILIGSESLFQNSFITVSGHRSTYLIVPPATNNKGDQPALLIAPPQSPVWNARCDTLHTTLRQAFPSMKTRSLLAAHPARKFVETAETPLNLMKSRRVDAFIVQDEAGSVDAAAVVLVGDALRRVPDTCNIHITAIIEDVQALEQALCDSKVVPRKNLWDFVQEFRALREAESNALFNLLPLTIPPCSLPRRWRFLLPFRLSWNEQRVKERMLTDESYSDILDNIYRRRFRNIVTGAGFSAFFGLAFAVVVRRKGWATNAGDNK